MVGFQLRERKLFFCPEMQSAHLLQALRNIQQAFDRGVQHHALHFLKGELLWRSTMTSAAASEAMAEYELSYKLKPDWKAMMGCAKTAVAGGKRSEVSCFPHVTILLAAQLTAVRLQCDCGRQYS